MTSDVPSITRSAPASPVLTAHITGFSNDLIKYTLLRKHNVNELRFAFESFDLDSEKPYQCDMLGYFHLVLLNLQRVLNSGH